MYLRNLDSQFSKLIFKKQSALLLGPRQTGKTTLVKGLLAGKRDIISIPLQNPEIRLEMETDPSRIIKQVEASPKTKYVFIDEAQKVPELFDAVQYMIDEKMAAFIITGSSARKLRRKGVNLLPGRVRNFQMDPILWNEAGWISDNTIKSLSVDNINVIDSYSFEESLIYGTLPGIISLPDNKERKEALKAYTHIYLEEEIRAEALSRKIGAFGRFLNMAARESGSNPNLTKLSRESGASVPTIKEFYNILEDTLVVEKVEPFTRNARKRLIKSPRYYFFDTGVRNALARFPLTSELINIEKGRLFEHAVMLEIIRRIRAKRKDYKVCYWRTSGGAEVDCVIDSGTDLIPIEIKAGKNVSLSQLRGLLSFIQTYPGQVNQAYVITNGRLPEKLADRVTALPWQFL